MEKISFSHKYWLIANLPKLTKLVHDTKSSHPYKILQLKSRSPYVDSSVYVCVLLMCADVKPMLGGLELVASEAAASSESSSLLTSSEGAAVQRRHKAREHKRVYRCSLCSKIFQNSSNLNRHIRSHGKSQVSSFTAACDEANWSRSSKVAVHCVTSQDSSVPRLR